MSKGAKLSLIVLIAVIVAGGVWYMCSKGKTSSLPEPETQEPSGQAEIKVDIKQAQEEIPVFEEILDEETGETVVAEVQENAPSKKKSTEPPEKPKSNESYTNPEAPPQYSEEQIKVAEKPTSQPAPKPKTNDGEKVYVEGFGYVESGASTQSKTGQSSGDINKMVGTMD